MDAPAFRVLLAEKFGCFLKLYSSKAVRSIKTSACRSWLVFILVLTRCAAYHRGESCPLLTRNDLFWIPPYFMKNVDARPPLCFFLKLLLEKGRKSSQTRHPPDVCRFGVKNMHLTLELSFDPFDVLTVVMRIDSYVDAP